MRKLLPFLTLLLAFAASAQVPSYVPQNGLKCYWPFSGNTDDVSSNASHLTNNGATLTADRNGTPNSAYSFNGTNQYMTRTNPSFTFSATGSFTVSVWMNKATSGSGTGGVAMMNGSTAGGNFIWLMQGGSSNMSFGTNKQQSSWINIAAPFVASTWIHYVCVYDNGQMYFYKDNVLESTGTFTYTSVTSANLPFFLGKGLSGGFFNADMDDLGIWDRALTACEISDLYTASSTITSVSASPDITVCSGSPVTLNGAATGTDVSGWDNGITNGVPFTPLTSNVYTFSGVDTTTGCTAWAQTNVTVNTGLVDAGADQVICDGTPVTLTASNGTSISWNNGVTDGVAFTPTTTQTYMVTGTDTTGCTGSDQVLVSLYQPAVQAGSDVTICAGDSVMFNASGALTYVWSNSVSNGTYGVPASTGDYAVVGTDTAGCANVDSVYITVNPLSNIQAGPDKNICIGQQVTLSATGGLFYIWDNGAIQNSQFSPQATTTYTVTGADSSNCYNSDTIVVFVNLPTSSTVSINAVDQYDLNGTIYSTSGTYTQVIPNAAGCDSTITLTLSLDFTGLEEIEELGLSWFPNPTADVLNVKIDAKVTGRTLNVFANDGRIVKSIVLGNELNQINVAELEAGVYVCRIEGSEGVNFRWVKK